MQACLGSVRSSLDRGGISPTPYTSLPSSPASITPHPILASPRSTEGSCALFPIASSVPRSPGRFPDPSTSFSNCAGERDFLIDYLLVRINFIIEKIWWTGLAPWEFAFTFPGSLTYVKPFSVDCWSHMALTDKS